MVIGATGRVGSEVVNLLKKGEVPFKAGVRNLAQAQTRFGEGVELVHFDFQKHETHKTVCEGTSKVFLVFPPQVSYKKHVFPFIDSAREAGVEQIVFLSLLKIENYRFMPHYHVEQYIMQSGMAYTSLRANFFMQNLDSVHQEEIRDRDIIFIPAGKGKTSLIDVRDIAVLGVKALTEEEHKNLAYPLTGGESVDYYEAAEAFTEVLGRKITYRNPSLFWFVLRRVFSPIPFPIVVVMGFLYTLAKKGKTEEVEPDLERLLGRKPKTLKEYINDYSEKWMRVQN